jgi:CTP:molybdopterin cytidylyltransferase MocA
MSAPALVVMAAGIGSRYGGLKQIEPIGLNGELIIDYLVYDALRAGFGQVVFIITRQIEAAFRAAFVLWRMNS